MFQTETLQIQKPSTYQFAGTQEFLEAQRIMQQAFDKFIEYATFCKKADVLRKKTGITSQKKLESFLSKR